MRRDYGSQGGEGNDGSFCEVASCQRKHGSSCHSGMPLNIVFGRRRAVVWARATA